MLRGDLMGDLSGDGLDVHLILRGEAKGGQGADEVREGGGNGLVAGAVLAETSVASSPNRGRPSYHW